MAARTQTFFTNGKLFTARTEEEFASAFAVEGGRITWVGHSEEVGAVAADAEVIDLRGRTVLPGFLDIHAHPTWVALTLDAVHCGPPRVGSIPEMVEALRAHPAVGRGPDAWIEGWGYDESRLAERRPPTRHDLDRVSTTQPVYVGRSDFHSGACNTRALAIAGIAQDTPDPPGARYGRDADGSLNGVLEEMAAAEVILRAKDVRGYDDRVRGIAGAGEHYARRGIVAITDMLAQTRPFDELRIYRDAAARGLHQQAALYFAWSQLKDGPLPELTDAEREGRVRFAGVKLFADGTISGRTAWLDEPYRGSSATGYCTLDEDDLRSAHEWARRNHVQVAVHTMGDRAIGHVLDYFADQEPWLGEDVPSVRLEHVTLLREDHARRMAEARMRFGAAMQVIFLFAEQDAYAAHLGDERHRRAYPARTGYETLDAFGLSSDAPATLWPDPDNVFVSIRAAVTRTAYNGADIGRDQALTVAQAVRLYTARAAAVTPFDGRLGQIAPGFEASFTVLDRDPFTIEPEEIDCSRIEQTWIGGEKVYAAEAATG